TKPVRLPEPPLLLCDRILGIKGEPGNMGTGVIWTETDVTEDAWYLHEGHMPAGITIESGQADLLLISWLGVDFLNRGERVYRLLGCELTYHGHLPQPGDTLHYKIHVDGHAKHGDVRLFFFHYDCTINGKVRLSVRHGQAGFFTLQELNESMGVLWDAKDNEYDTNARLDPPAIHCDHQQFSRQQIQAFAAGKPFECFGKGYELLAAQLAPPSISSGNMLFLHEIPIFEVDGGPWGRGYMKALQYIQADDWFFNGHFYQDPCMPGTLMLEAGLQVIAFYMTAIGMTVGRDGWRFEPVPEKTYKLRCRGQVIPSSKLVSYEIFVESVVFDDEPVIFVDLLGSVDGLKSFHTKIGVRLVPAWPLKENTILHEQSSGAPVPEFNGFKFDYRSLLACAWGKPSMAFGKLYQPFDRGRKVARLPGPPYHCISRIISVDSPMGEMQSGGTVIAEFDVDPNAWYFQQNLAKLMPYAVFMEAALQPCGWLASYMGCALAIDEELMFRNLDGKAVMTAAVLPTSGSIRNVVKNKSVSRSGKMIIVAFHVQTYCKEEKIYDLDTVFGFFPAQAFANQAGLPIEEHEKNCLTEHSDFNVNLKQRQTEYFSNLYGLPGPGLLMLDAISGFWPQGGKYNKGRLRAAKTIDPNEWFFKAHFFQDPVQPGSLGVEAILQTLQFYVLHCFPDKCDGQAYFEPVIFDEPVIWKYRGQVVPTNKQVIISTDIKQIIMNESAVTVLAESSYFVDGTKIYSANPIGIRLVTIRN
ncbi:MAG: 3-hydroxyacyl-[acyl-carrier-protein] dehydratase FabA, partial [Pseudomonadota bacterium]